MKKIRKKGFYKVFIFVSLPIVAKQIILNSALVIDNLMVGQLGDSAVRATGIATQIMFIPTFVIFGLSHGSGIWMSQFNGSKNKEKVELSHAIKTRFIVSIVFILSIFIFLFTEPIAKIFTSDPLAIKLVKDYLNIYLFSFLIWGVIYSYGNSYSTIGKPSHSLYPAIGGGLLNIGLNYYFIFVLDLRITGAALGTLISRTLEMTYLVFFSKVNLFVQSRFKWLFKKDKILTKGIILSSVPLVLNELLWSSGMVVRMAIWSSYGNVELAALSIQNNIQNIINVAFAGFSGAVVFMIGKSLGKGKTERAMDDAKKLIKVSLIIGFVAGLVLFIITPLVVGLYNVDNEAAKLAITLTRINSLYFFGFLSTAVLFFIIRAGGDARNLLLVDAGHMWIVTIPVVLIVRYWTNWPLEVNVAIEFTLGFLKTYLFYRAYKKYNWVRNLTKDKDDTTTLAHID